HGLITNDMHGLTTDLVLCFLFPQPPHPLSCRNLESLAVVMLQISFGFFRFILLGGNSNNSQLGTRIPSRGPLGTRSNLLYLILLNIRIFSEFINFLRSRIFLRPAFTLVI